MMITTLLAALLHCGSPLMSPGMIARSATMYHAPGGSGLLFGGEPFVAPEAGFRLVLPSGFAVPVRSAEPPGADGDDFHYAAVREHELCTIAVMKYPYVPTADSLRKRIVNEAMQSTLEGMGRKRNLVVTGRTPVTLGGLPGRSALVTITTGEQRMQGRLDVCINGDRVYELLFLTTDGTSVDREDVRDLFASFSVFAIETKARPTAADGVPFAPEEGGFSVILPSGSAEPEVNSQPVPAAGADAKLFRYSTHDQEGTYFLITSPLPRELSTEAERASLLERILTNQVRNLNAEPDAQATVISRRDTLLGGIPHHIVIMSARSEGQPGWHRLDFMIVASRLYQLIAILPSREGLAGEQIERYFSSFTLTPGKKE